MVLLFHRSSQEPIVWTVLEKEVVREEKSTRSVRCYSVLLLSSLENVV